MNKGMLSSKRHDWRTPPAFFARVQEEFNLEIDLCATAEDSMLGEFFSPQQDSLRQVWAPRRGWLNPPYGSGIASWVEKAADSAAAGATVVALLPARTCSEWFHKHCMRAVEIRFLQGRLYFSGGGRAPFPSMLAIFRPGSWSATMASVDVRKFCGRGSVEVARA